MNSLYLILIGICFSAGVLTSVIKSDDPDKLTHILDKHKNEQSNVNKAIMDYQTEELKPLTIFTK